ncbi:vancomycin high temperature exclusion protein [Lonepinella sp. MS14437]|uniref:SanA/YdcF family protein n=1 Tax=Lonepinella sp. MS14437 TaxID=3003620 RepID=UPI0036DE7E7C
MQSTSQQNKLVYYLTKITIRRLIYTFASLIVLVILMLISIDQFVSYKVRDDIYHNIEQTPYRPYAVVLGTAKYVTKNTPNQFYNYRLESTKALFDAEKIDYILLSGDNRTLQYNEPRTMQRDLIKMGIEPQYLFPDYAGFRTLDSIIRAKEVFKAEPMIIISQRFHCERALFIAKYHHIDAICFVADNPNIYTETRLREIFARFLMVWELITEKKPHFLGEPEPLPAPLNRHIHLNQSAVENL